MIWFVFQRLKTQCAVAQGFGKQSNICDLSCIQVGLHQSFGLHCSRFYMCLLPGRVNRRSGSRRVNLFVGRGQSLSETSCDSTCTSGVRLIYRKLVAIATQVVSMGWKPETLEPWVNSTSPAQNGQYCWLLDADCAKMCKIYHNSAQFMKDPRVCQRRSLGLARFSMSSDGARTSFGSLRALNTPRSLGKSWNILGWRNISKYHLLNHCIRFHTLNWIPRKQLQKGHRLSGCWPVTVTSEHFRANKIKHIVRQPPKSAQKQQCKSIEPCQLKRCAHQFWRILCGFPVQSTVFSSQSFVRGSNFFLFARYPGRIVRTNPLWPCSSTVVLICFDIC